MSCNFRLYRGLVVLFCFFLIPVSDIQASVSDGRVSVQGTIVNASCTLRTDNREQLVVVPPVSAYRLRTSGRGGDSWFEVYLSNCLLHDVAGEQRSGWTDFIVTVNGTAPKDGVITLLPGEKQNTRLQISRATRSGMASVNSGEERGYALRLITSSQQVLTGEVSSSVRFILDYY